ncbi:hypothetical protein [uncultured Devosia sp.]|uniref:ATP-binding protein n=1 Tax=uncultured Devosia sp. TaxID=211434 RepID=UPI00261C0C1C|nr:hypothetical protein [uncultured Devosia sp.]
MKFPISDDALDDRLAILGTAGSGKTYLTTTAIERLLKSGNRVVAVDPLGVMWGLRLKADGKTASPFNVVIFGGRHGDLPLTEHAGALIGETVATMRESCIIDLSELPTKAAERRFMTAFLEAIYRHTDPTKVDPFHLIIDEADRFAPQKPPAGDETMLNRMEEIVRRGRVKGFIPWLITQRPAVLNKNVLSQADGLVLLKLTSSQDRDQVGAWIEGQADKAQGKAILGSLPAMQRGQGVVWIPGRGILETVQFPKKTTFDSSSAPKRGEKRNANELKPLDVGKLKDRLATVEADTKANDPKALRAEVTKLRAELAKVDGTRPNSHLVAQRAVQPNAADQKAQERALAAAREEGAQAVRDQIPAMLDAQHQASFQAGFEFLAGRRAVFETDFIPARKPLPGRSTKALPMAASRPAHAPTAPSGPKPTLSRAIGAGDASGLTQPQRRILASIGFWLSVGNEAPTRAQVGGVAGYSPSSGGFNNLLGQLNSAGLITIPAQGRVSLAPGAPYDALDLEEAKAKVHSVLSNPERKLVNAMVEAGGGPMTRDDLGAATEYSPTSGGFNNLIGGLCTLTIFEKPAQGQVALSAWAREVLAA